MPYPIILGGRFRGEDWLQYPAEEQRQQEANDESAQHSNIFEHFAELESFYRGFGLRHVLAKEHEAVTKNGDEVKGELHLPTPLKLVIQQPAKSAADNQARRPTGVQNI